MYVCITKLLLLSVGSAVFDAMFNSTWPTSNEEIPLPDVEPASFLALLKFLYSDEVQVHYCVMKVPCFPSSAPLKRPKCYA